MTMEKKEEIHVEQGKVRMEKDGVTPEEPGEREEGRNE
jgi:hypothetical protein